MWNTLMRNTVWFLERLSRRKGREYHSLKKSVCPCLCNTISFHVQHQYSSNSDDVNDNENDDFDLDDYCDEIDGSDALRLGDQNVFVLQPDVVRGARDPALFDTTPELQLAESLALVDCISGWTVSGKLILKTSTPADRQIFRGERLKKLTSAVMEQQNTTALFISFDRINMLQREILTKATKIETIFDRYTLVLEIFRLRAQTKQAKLQVALAEIPYIRSNLKSEIATYNRPGGGARAVGPGESPLELMMRPFRSREQKIKKRLEILRKRRTQQREVRKRSRLPVIAVVGYTNAGKTTLIKSLSKSERLSPKDQLFATLDVTTHAAVTGKNMKYLMVDTVGFLSSLPHSLIDAFSATMEDMLQADIILHICDISHPDYENQKVNVWKVLSDLQLPPTLLNNMIEVRNKVDLVDERKLEESDPMKCNESNDWKRKRGKKFNVQPSEVCFVSCTTGTGLTNLDNIIQKRIVEATGSREISVRVPASGDHLDWFNEYAAVTNFQTDGDYHFIIDIMISKGMWNKFRTKYYDYKVVS